MFAQPLKLAPVHIFQALQEHKTARITWWGQSSQRTAHNYETNFAPQYW